MNFGPVIFFAAFLAVSGSWFTFVVRPSMQLGRLQQTNVLGGTVSYPVARPGLAQQGLEVYRANGCAYCHSQQVRQSGTLLQVMLAEAGTNAAEVASALRKLNPSTDGDPLASLPRVVYRGTDRFAFEDVAKVLNGAGAKTIPQVVPYGPDIGRGWGNRRTVAEDFLWDRTVLPGSMRAGPDLANTGLRLPDVSWHLRHLYAPRSEVAGSTMPPYRYLFETRKIGRAPSPNALVLAAGYGPEAGYEVVPRPEAVALAAYLVSLRADAPLFSSPMTLAPSAARAGETNNASGTGTNTNGTNPASISAR